MTWIPRWRTVAVVLFVFVAVSLFTATSTVSVVRANDFIQLMVSPTLSENNDMFVQVLVARDADNQLMRVTAESESYFSSSEMILDGEYSPRIRSIRFRSVPSGSYEVTGTVYDRRSKVKGSARKTVLVFGRGN
jgi:hypothetical protein